MFNVMEDPSDMLVWLSQRNQHIPLEDLAYMLESKELNNITEEPEIPNFIDRDYPE